MSVRTIRELLGERPLQSVSPDTPLSDAARLMASRGVGAVAVLDGDRLAGVLSERDIVFRAVARDLPPAETTAGAVMTADPVTVGADEAISDALAAKLGDAFRHLPVLEDGRILGLLSYRDVPAEYLMMFERFKEMSSAKPADGA